MQWNKATLAMWGILLLCGSMAFALAPQPESFDKPLRTKVVNFGRSKYHMPNNPSQVQLTCFYFESFAVKQFVDPGMKGSQSVTVVPVANGQVLPCEVKRDPAERDLTDDGWYFIGAKDRFFFLEAPDGDGAGMPFRVIEAGTRLKILEDSIHFYRKSHMDFARAASGALTLRYLRVVGEDCSIPKDGASCWTRFIKDYNLVSKTLPVCQGYRREGEKAWKIGDPGVPPADIDTPSNVAYPVSVLLNPKPSIGSLPGPVQCSPQQ